MEELLQDLHVALPVGLENMQLPAPELVNYYRLAEHRIFYIDYDIDESVLEIQKAILTINIADRGIEPDQRVPIKIYIDSSGGSLDEALSMTYMCLLSKTPIITINIALAASGAGLILMGGHKRYALRGSRAVIHSGSVSGLSGTFEQSEEFQRNYRKQVDEMGKFIMERTKIDEKTYKRNRSKDWYLNAEEQVRYGIVDEIVTDLEQIL